MEEERFVVSIDLGQNEDLEEELYNIIYDKISEWSEEEAKKVGFDDVGIRVELVEEGLNKLLKDLKEYDVESEIREMVYCKEMGR